MTKYGEKLKSDKELFALVQRAAQLLEHILGPSAGQVTADWDLNTDGKGRTIVTLRISDWTGDWPTVFAPQDLDEQSQLRVRLYHVWGEFLQARNEKQLRELQGTSG